MRIKSVISSIVLLALSSAVYAELVPFEDFEASDAVWSVTTIKVDSNMGEAYLEGLRETWVPGVEAAVKLGHMESWHIYTSDLPASGDFNLLLVIKYANTSDLAPNKARYEAFMKELGEAKSKETSEYARKNYPGMRTITGQYQLREITFK